MKSIKHLLIPEGGFNLRKFVVIALAAATVGVGVVLISRASIPVYTTHWEYWGPRIRGCESGSGVSGAGIYTAQNSTSTASGAYQFLDGTWGNYKGYAKGRLAPPEIQEEKAYLTFIARGTQPWNASYTCWASAPPVDTILSEKPKPLAVDPLVPGAQDLAVDAKNITIVSTPPADGLDPWVGSPVVQFLRLFGLFRN